jgi:hypothetical protein
MAYNKDQEDFSLPDANNSDRSASNFLPKYFRTDINKKFINSTIDQMINPGVVEKIDAYAGRRHAKATKYTDNFLQDFTANRENYQFEPVAVYKDELNNVEFLKNYNDYIAQIKNFKGTVSNHSLLNSQEFYAWDPHIDWDKFVNFREYYWLPTGPVSIAVAGQSNEVVSTYTVTLADDGDNLAYVFTPNGFTRNPTLKLYRGQTYRFEIDTPGHPIAIAVLRNFTDNDLTVNTDFDNTSNLYTDGVSSVTDYVDSGVIEFVVSETAPDTLYYISKNDINTSGVFSTFDIESNTEINVAEEIIGKKTYKTSTGVELSNGMKLFFQGAVTPEKYATGNWYVEGVGSQIHLVAESDLAVPAIFTADVDIPFDSAEIGFDLYPFDTATSFAGTKDYIAINRASADGNPWTRYNRWFHRDIIKTSFLYNNLPVVIDESARAKRPIIEFEAGLKLFNHGTKSKLNVDLVDTFTTDVFSTVEGSIGYNVDNVDLVDGMNILFTKDTDITVKGKIYKVNFILHNGINQISLTEIVETNPYVGEVVLVRYGVEYKGKMFYFDGEEWILSQEKTEVNQPPLFSLYNNNEISFSDTVVYPANSFNGNKLFSYRVGNGLADTELGFPLSYKNIANVGDIVFDFNLLSDNFSYQDELNVPVTLTNDTGYLKKYNTTGDTNVYVNAWKKAVTDSKQLVIRQYNAALQLNNFLVDVFDNSGSLTDLRVIVYVNNVRKVANVDYEIQNTNGTAKVVFVDDVSTNDLILLRCYSAASKNDNGFYEIPANLEHNPLNENITDFTLGQVNDHLDSIVEDLPAFSGNFPGSSNLRDLGSITANGKTFVQHSGPVNLALYHITDKDANVIKSLKYARREYAKFKRKFINESLTTGFDGNIKDHVDLILVKLLKDKTPNMPFFFSDMIGVGAATKTIHTVEFTGPAYFALTIDFNLTALSTSSVGVYKNNIQLLHARDYTFVNGFVYVTADLQDTDTVEIYEYESTNGSFIPPTPTKLGLYPSYQPAVYTDDTYVESKTVIRGHDGSQMIAFDDYRDDLLVELETRIYNNIKCNNNKELIDINEFVGGYARNTGHSTEAISAAILSDFAQWLEISGSPDYSTHDFWDNSNTFTYNYSNTHDLDGNPLPGFWRGIYKKYYDTDAPHARPWEMLGFTIMPQWWETAYGPAPYTSNNRILWNDLKEGIFREPGKSVVRDSKYIRPDLLKFLPVDEFGRLLSPLESGLAQNFSLTSSNTSFKFGDMSPVEAAWKKTSEYPFSLITAWVLLQPTKIIGLGFDCSRIERSITGNIVYTDTQKAINLSSLALPSISSSDTIVLTSGLVNYVADYMVTKTEIKYNDYKEKLVNLTNQLAIKLGGYGDKTKLKLILDSRSPLNKTSVFVPNENYQIEFATSNALDIVVLSGIIIEKTALGYIISGYDKEDPVFNFTKPIVQNANSTITVGGISESFINWTENKGYTSGTVVEYQGKYYRTKITHTSLTTFDSGKFVILASLPVVGGITASVRTMFEDTVTSFPYGTLLSSVQEVADFMTGYENYLVKQGFVFDFFNQETNAVEDMKLCIQEFMFWVTQNWDNGTVLTVSPVANNVTFEREYFVVDDIYDSFYDYNLLTGEGNRISKEFSNIFRNNANEFGVKPVNSIDGIFLVKLPLVQKEHIILVDNNTVFNDTIFDMKTGYRQERIKVVGYRTDNWTGGLNAPGFIYDTAKVTLWKEWTDYAIGDVVKYKEFFYAANLKHTGTDFFDANFWNILAKRPEAELLPNWDYRVNQFTDFYSLDTDNFDSEQQRLGQHLIGYQKREYLANIIPDAVSQYKFYQGFIQDKGTKNALTKLFDALSSANKDSLEFFEEWAIRLGQYGAVENITEVEYNLDEANYRLEPQLVELANSISSTRTDLVYEIAPHQTYVKPNNYDHDNLFTELSGTETYAKDSGYVRDQDVSYLAEGKDQILALLIDNILIGEFIWVKDNKQSWTVLRHVNSNYQVSNIVSSLPDNLPVDTENKNGFTVYFDEHVTFNEGDIIGIKSGILDINGFFKVAYVSLNEVVILTDTPVNINEFTDSTALAVTKFVQRRFSDATDLNDTITDIRVDLKDAVWIDNAESGKWGVYENSNIFALQDEIVNPTDSSDGFASSFAASETNNIVVIGSPNNETNPITRIYRRFSESSPSILLQDITATDEISSNSLYGFDVAVSASGDFIAVGAPSAISTDNLTVGLPLQGAVFLYSRNQNGTYDKIKTILSPTPAENQQFGYQVELQQDESGVTRLFVGAPGLINEAGKIYVVDNSTTEWSYNNIVIDTVKKFSVNKFGDVILTSSPINTTNQMSVYRKQDDGTFDNSIMPVISEEDSAEEFGYAIAINDAGDQLAISAPRNDDAGIDAGAVYIYSQTAASEYVLSQVLNSPFDEKNEAFGTGLDFSLNKLAISGKNTDTITTTSFDNYFTLISEYQVGVDYTGTLVYSRYVFDQTSASNEANTTFDGGTTRFANVEPDTGRIAVFQKIGESFIFGEDVNYRRNTKFNDISNFKLVDNHIYIGFPKLNPVTQDPIFEGTYIGNDSSVGMFADLRADANSNSWSTITQESGKIDISKIQRCFVYSKDKNDIISNLDIIDPRQGKIAGPAEQELEFKTFYDPAVYTINANNTPGATVDSSSNWTENYVGKLWWNLDTVSWYNPYQGDVQYRANNWNKVTIGSTVDVLEWVGTNLLPLEWNAIAGTNEGFAQGVSGTALYGNDIYSLKRVYDTVSRSFTSKYFYWVSSSRIIPNSSSRRLSAFDIAALIRDPAAAGYRFVAPLDTNKFAVYNSKNLFEGTNSILHYSFATDPNLQTNIHREYQLITEDLATSRINNEVEIKWFDSLIGYDQNSNPVPDPELPVKQRHGILNFPRQGMFVNRLEAVKQVVERVNSVLTVSQIVDDTDFSTLLSKDEPPSPASGIYDTIVDTVDQLSFVSVARAARAELEPIIENTRVVGVNIINSGRGYTVAPKVIISDGSGTGAVVNTVINNLGQVTSVTVKSVGKNYSDTATILVRKFSVLVSTDTDIGNRWAIYSWDTTSQSWTRIDNQSFDTTRYWDYTNWYAAGYNSQTAINHIVTQTYKLNGLNDDINDVIKIENVGAGGWLLLRKISNNGGLDFTVNYETIGRENGTIQISTKIYDYASTASGFDATIYDNSFYDREPVVELRNILIALRDNLFDADLSVEWNKLFFASMRYAFSEQSNINWAFKTSFVRAKHNLGMLTQKVTFQNDNLSNYEDYVNEVKPYSTKVREYISSYEHIEPTQSLTTDFDLPPTYNIATSKIEPTVATQTGDEITNLVTQYFQPLIDQWTENNGYEIIRIDVVNGGDGYKETPLVTVSGDHATTATAFLSRGSVKSVVIDNPGKKYYTTPIITIVGDQETGSTPATAVAIIGNGKVRSTHMTIKFDRVSGSYVFTELNETESFEGTATKETFNLKWPININTNSYTVIIDGIEQLASAFKIGNSIDTSKGYDRYVGYIDFVNSPVLEAQITIRYQKDIKLLAAADRINFFYNPTTGMLGKDLTQLIDGTEYSGVTLNSFNFGNNHGWDIAGYGSLPWDTFDESDQDEIFILDASTTIFELSQPLENAVEYNFYLNGTRLDDPDYGTSSPVTNTGAVMQTIIGNGTTSTVTIDEALVPTVAGDIVIIRKSTSDGAANLANYDTQLSGGDLGYTTATGIDSGEIKIDGDDFVTPTTSKGPEELVPGEIRDTLDIQVYHRPGNGAGIIGTANYNIDGTQSVFTLPEIPQTNDSVIVKVDNIILGSDLYTIDHESQTLSLDDSTLPVGSRLSITAIGTNGINLIDTTNFLSDGSTTSFVTSAIWSDQVSSLITANGIILKNGLEYLLSETVIEDGFLHRVKIEFSNNVLAEGDFVQYSLYSTLIKTHSQVDIDKTFVPDGSSNYHIFNGSTSTVPFNNLPISHNILVKVNNKILNPGYSISYTTTDSRIYDIEEWQFRNTTIDASEVFVFANHQQLTSAEYTFDLVNMRINIPNNQTAPAGTRLDIYVIKDAEYYFVDTKIVFDTDVSSIVAVGDTLILESVGDSTVHTGIVTSVNTTELTIKSLRTEIRDSYLSNDNFIVSVSSGPVTDVVVTNVTYVTSEGMTFVTPPLTTDVVEIYQFSNHDINNFERITYKVITDPAITMASADFATRNLVATGFIPLRGIISTASYAWVTVNGELLTPDVDYSLNSAGDTLELYNQPTENDVIDVIQFGATPITDKFGFRMFKDMLNRVHYKRLNQDNSYVLSNPLNYYDIGISLENTVGMFIPDKVKNIPGVLFIDGERIEYFEINGNQVQQLRRGTLGTGVKETHSEGTRAFGAGPDENINYTDTTINQSVISDGSTDIVLDYTPDSINEIEVYVAGHKLRKSAIKRYNPALQQDSPEGNETIDAEFTLDGNTVVFNIDRTDPLPKTGERVSIIRKVGKVWNEDGKSLANTNNIIGNFLRGATIELPK